MVVFKDQIKAYKAITQDILNQIEYKTVWSGKRIEVGDKVLYAFVYPLNSEDYKLATFLERELDYISKSFKDSVNEMSKQNLYLSNAKKSLRGISDISSYGHLYRIMARLSEQDQTFWTLKWGNK